MIYYVTKQSVLYNYPDVKVINSIDELYNFKSEYYQFDLETTSLSCHSGQIVFWQIGNEDTQFVVNNGDFPIQEHKDFFIDKKLIIQNALFELQWLFKKRIILKENQVYDTMIAEQVSYLGFDEPSSLDYLVDKYCNIELDKSTRDLFVSGTWNNNGYTLYNAIKYSGLDVKYLENIMLKQKVRLDKYNLNEALRIQLAFLRPLAYMAYNGMHLNTEKWLNRVENLKPLLLEKEQEVFRLISEDNRVKSKVSRDLFTGNVVIFNDNKDKKLKKSKLNLNSSKQIVKIFKQLGLDLTNEEGKDSVQEDIIAKYEYEPIVMAYIEYKKLYKSYSTYGENFLDYINPNTQRIHTDYIQLRNTGRHSSSKPNLQNIPREEITRSCFEGQGDNVLVCADYSDQEGRIFANYSKDKALIEFYHSGESDGHSYTAKLCWPDVLGNLTLKEIKDTYPELRQKAKGARFAIQYGGDGYTIAKNLNLAKEEGDEVYKKYLKAFSGFAAYKKKVQQQTAKNGFITISPYSKLKFFSPNFENLSPQDWEYREFLKLGLNYPVQGSASEMSKIALIRVFRWIEENDLLFTVLLIGFIYDEIIAENPPELAEEVAKVIKQEMEFAASLYCKYVPIYTKPEINKVWKH